MIEFLKFRSIDLFLPYFKKKKVGDVSNCLRHKYLPHRRYARRCSTRFSNIANFILVSVKRNGFIYFFACDSQGKGDGIPLYNLQKWIGYYKNTDCTSRHQALQLNTETMQKTIIEWAFTQGHLQIWQIWEGHQTDLLAEFELTLTASKGQRATSAITSADVEPAR